MAYELITELFDALIPVCICVVLPVLIVRIVGKVKQNETNRKAEIMLKALESECRGRKSRKLRRERQGFSLAKVSPLSLRPEERPTNAKRPSSPEGRYPLDGIEEKFFTEPI